MAVKRIVSTSFWTDGKVDEFSPEDKYFMLYLLTNPFGTQLGIYEISIKQAAFQLGYSIDAVKVLIDRFENKYGMVRYSPQTGEIAIKNYLKHSIVKGGAPVRDLLVKELKRVKDRSLIPWVFSNIKDAENLNDTVKKIIEEYELKNGILNYCNEKEKRTKKEIQNENENENENENDVSYPDSYNESYNDSSHDSSTNRSSSPAKPTKKVRHKYGRYQNVLLDDEQLEKLKTEFPSDWTQRIENLSEYIASTGKSYKNHLATIRSWARKDTQNPKKTDSRRFVRNERIFRSGQTPDDDYDIIVGPFDDDNDEPKQLPTEKEVEEFTKNLKANYPDFSDARYESAVESFRNGTWK